MARKPFNKKTLKRTRGAGSRAGAGTSAEAENATVGRVARRNFSSTSSKKTKRPADTQARINQQIRKEIWPAERGVLFRPDRLRYVRKLIKPETCVFCSSIESGRKFESLLLHRGEDAVVILNKYPYNNGHLLILPRRHCGDFLELTARELQELQVCLQRSVRALQAAYKPSGFNVGLNLGSAAGAGIPEHLHYHVIPRWVGDTNFFPLIAETKVVVETLEQSYEALLPYFQEF